MKTGRQFARTPFLVSFQASWFKFDICTVHIYFGAESGTKLKRRVKEIDGIAKELSQRAELLLKERKSMILLGDFNIVHQDHQTMKALAKYKFIIPEPIIKPSNVKGDKYYDQIAVKSDNANIVASLNSTDPKSKNGGVFELFESIMREEDYLKFKTRMKHCEVGKKCKVINDYKKHFKTWRTYHLSDHKPIWIRIPIDESQRYLDGISRKG